MVDRTRGVLYPARLPAFHRLPPPEDAAALVAWFWIPEWSLPEGEVSRQEIVAYPAVNLVVAPEGVSISGATTRASTRELRGSGWAVGALLRPAAVVALTDDAPGLIDAERSFDAPDLHEGVTAAMRSQPGRRERAVAVFSAWLSQRVGPVGAVGRQANAMFDVLLGEGAALTPEEAATRLAVSVRTLQRLTHRTVGLSPGAIIRRRRLQEAAQRLREEPETDLTSLAAALGYADHAHLTRDFAAVLGLPPRDYRAGVSG
ncbi:MULTISPECIES: helix-turn-helix domain-containing protein [unclassified Microbacterium]|uniref:AraC family transcriptional regulator n=1 Tax=unclassified Microbacterium TaxID=2609290 RepID=UPI0028AD2347|nr:helix-turn-helix domain-containing protein [Microbacterium sp.]